MALWRMASCWIAEISLRCHIWSFFILSSVIILKLANFWYLQIINPLLNILYISFLYLCMLENELILTIMVNSTLLGENCTWLNNFLWNISLTAGSMTFIWGHCGDVSEIIIKTALRKIHVYNKLLGLFLCLKLSVVSSY